MPNQTEPRGKSVLIVEDDRVTRRALVSLLTQLGYATVPAATVAEGLQRLNGQDCAILDIHLPDGLGTRVLERIRDEGRPIHVAIASATTDAAQLDHARRLDAELILSKPIDVDALLDWLEHAD